MFGTLSEMDLRYAAQAQWTSQFQVDLLRAHRSPPPWRVLEVGGGTGAVLAQMRESSSSLNSFFSIDLDWCCARYASLSKRADSVCGDGAALPFPNETFDLTFCHYFLLWVESPIAVLTEMMRVTRKGGIIASIAEPDYDARIMMPDELAKAGQEQANVLVRQGVCAQAGRLLPTWFHKAGLYDAQFGVHGAEWGGSPYQDFLRAELCQLEKDIGCLVDWTDNDPAALFYIPTFYGVAKKN